jgi:nucleoside-diphosphate-sugar epimerase
MGKLVIGGGYLGRRVARRWREAGEKVFVTTRRPGRAVELAREGFEPVLCDVQQPDELPVVDGLVWCVGLDRAAGSSMRAVYVEGLVKVLAVLPGRPRWVHVSSTSVYGQAGGEVVDEQADTNPVDESGRVVLEAEQVLRRQRPDAIVLRFAGIYGPGRLPRAAAVRAGEVLATDPHRWLNLIHVEDGAAAVVAAEDRAAPGATYNVADDQPVCRGDFYARLADLLGAPPPRFAPQSAAQEGGDRRISNARMHRELGVELRYPGYEVGLAASVVV